MKSKKYIFFLLIFFIIGNLNLIIHLGDFIYLGSSSYSDIPISHYPNLLFIKNSIKYFSQIPLWSNLNFSGSPFASNLLSGLWYFPGWIALLFPLPLGINFTLLLHLGSGMLGMFLFLKQLNVSEKSALFGSVVFIFSSKLYAHIGAGHLSLIYAISWTPWLLFFTTRDSWSNQFKKNLLVGLTWGLLLLADLRWSVPALLIWITLIVQLKINVITRIKDFIQILIIGFLTSNAVWLPLINNLPFTTRSVMNSADQMVYSVSPMELLNLFFPNFEGSAELRIYPGAIIILLLFIGIFYIKQDKKILPWYVLAIVSLLLSMGENIPGMNYVFEIPGLSFTRVPARFLFVLVFSLIVISVKVLEKLSQESQSIYAKKQMILLFAIFIFVLLFSIGAMVVTKTISKNFIFPIIFYTLSFICIALMLNHKINQSIFTYLVISVIFLELLLVNSLSFTFKKSDLLIGKNKELMSFLQEDTSFFRVYTPSYSISQEQGAYWGIYQTNGVDPMQLNQYVEYFEDASGIPVNSYSVTLPPFANGNPEVDNKDFCPDKSLLNQLNTKYVISSFGLPTCGLGDGIQKSNSYVYKISEFDNYLQFLDCHSENVEYSLTKYSPNEIILNVESCGGILQISEVLYPGWKVFIDGQPSSLQSNTLLRQIYVPDGNHEVRMLYQPVDVIGSAFIQLLFWILGIGYLLISKSKNNESNLA